MSAKFSKPKPKVIFEKSKDDSVNDVDRVCNFKISFQYLDTTQKYGSSFKDWQKAGLLSKAMKRVKQKEGAIL